MKKIQSQFKYQSHIYNVQSNADVNHRAMKIRRNNKLFPSLNVINCKTWPYASKGIQLHYHCRSGSKLGPGIVVIRRITCSCHACIDILSLSW